MLCGADAFECIGDPMLKAESMTCGLISTTETVICDLSRVSDRSQQKKAKCQLFPLQLIVAQWRGEVMCERILSLSL
jgi:hypothetical protein